MSATTAAGPSSPSTDMGTQAASVLRGAGVGSRWVPMVVLLLALATLIGSGAAMVRWSGPGQGASVSQSGVRGDAGAGTGPAMMGGAGMMGGPGMMGGSGGALMSGRVWLDGDGVRVASIAAARARAAVAGVPAGLHPGEVIWFSNGFYVELKDAAANPRTEVLVDPAGGAVSTEPGPAMMWNTGSTSAAVSRERARSIAVRWLGANRPGEVVGSLDAYPGYYTVDTMVGGTTKAMLSVNASTGQVWYHTWHAAFIAKEDS